MPRPLFDSPYLFGFHDPGGESIMTTAGRPGWVVFTEGIGSDPINVSGFDYTPWSQQDLGIIARLNHGYGYEGTLPISTQYENFAKRCANFVANSKGCKIWIIGNEPNLPTERPLLVQNRSAQPTPVPEDTARPLRDTSDRNQQLQPEAIQSRPALGALRAFVNDREVISPTLYARCYQLCRAAIKALPGHANDQILIAGLAPWNNQTTYPGNEIGDWLRYFQDVLNTLGAGNVDGIALHVYTHGSDPALITTDAPMQFPFQNHQFNFRVYRDWMNSIPTAMRTLPVYITETDQIDPWLNSNSGWVQKAYAEINWWNNQPNNQQIRALCLYRWPNFDQWAIVGKSAVQDDFRAALLNPYRWRGSDLPATGDFSKGDTVRAVSITNLRQSPGYVGKTSSDVVVQMAANTRTTVLDSTPRSRDGLTWWNLSVVLGGKTFSGWAAQFIPQGPVLLEKVEVIPPPPKIIFDIGSIVRTLTSVRMRRSAGYLNKPASDIVKDLASGSSGTVIGGPTTADGLTWWLIRTTDNSATGWMAEALGDGTRLIEATASPPALPTFAIGDIIQTAAAVRVRRNPGYLNQPSDDVLGAFFAQATLNLVGGPQTADGLSWWQVGGIKADGVDVIGWTAQASSDGTQLLRVAAKLPGTNIPDKSSRTYLGAPYQGKFGTAQLWGENPAIYSQITYDGVPLLGHNGVDFLTPTGTSLLAVDSGVASEVVANDPTGFGNYVKLAHSWGETIYAHMLDFAVTQGQAVQRGQTIGRSGASGNVTGPHLHFAIRINPYSRTDGWGGYRDPLPYLNPADYQLPFYVLSSQQRAAIRALPTTRIFRGSGYAPDKKGVHRP